MTVAILLLGAGLTIDLAIALWVYQLAKRGWKRDRAG